MTQEGVIQILGPIHKQIVQKGTTYFLYIQERSLTASKMRWTVSTNSVKEREPFNYGNFKVATSRLIHIPILFLGKGLIGWDADFDVPLFGILLKGISLTMSYLKDMNR